MKYEVIEARFNTITRKRTEKVIDTFDNRMNACILEDVLRKEIPSEDRCIHDFYIQEVK